MSRYPFYNRKGVTRARNLRRRMTAAERKLWFKLRDNQLGARFRRQMPIGPYVADFISIKARLIVELDGSQHLEPSQVDRDRGRTAYLIQQGYLVLRFDDTELLRNPIAVLHKIKEEVDRRLVAYELSKPHPTLHS